MIKRIKLDKNQNLTEIDMKKVRRAALELKDYIEDAPQEEAQKYQYQQRVMPFICAALDGVMPVPNYDWVPYNRCYILEGIYPELPSAFDDLYSKFIVLTRAAAEDYSIAGHEGRKYDLNEYVETDPDGTKYEWCWFED